MIKLAYFGVILAKRLTTSSIPVTCHLFSLRTELPAEDQEIPKPDRAVFIQIVFRFIPLVAPACAEPHSKCDKVAKINTSVSIKVRCEFSQT